MMPADAVPSEAEIGSLARRLAEAYQGLVAARRELMQEGSDEAERQVRAADDPEWQHRAITEPVDQVSWWSLSPLIETDPEAGWAVWERVKAEALDELMSGNRAAASS
jgi:hypothetical protein